MHFAQNRQCTPAQFIASFPSSDLGTQTVASAFFSKLPEFALQATLGLDDDTIQAVQHVVTKVKSITQANPSLDLACLA